MRATAYRAAYSLLIGCLLWLATSAVVVFQPFTILYHKLPCDFWIDRTKNIAWCNEHYWGWRQVSAFPLETIDYDLKEKSYPTWAGYPPNKPKSFIYHGFGWPFVWLRTTGLQYPKPDADFIKHIRYRENRWKTLGMFEPYIPGIFQDILIFAGPTYLLMLTAITIRGLRRQRRGLCRACAYKLAGLTLARCPECGRPTL